MARIRMPQYSPYGPRPKRSAQLVVIWMVILVVALVVTFYLTTRERGAVSSYEGMRLVDKLNEEGGEEAPVVEGGGDGDGVGEKNKMAKMVP